MKRTRLNMELNSTHDPSRRSWVPSANQPDTDFPIQNLPFGIFRESGIARGGVAIGDRIFDLAAALQLGLFSGEAEVAARAASGDSLNPLMALGSRAASLLRARMSDLLRIEGPERARTESRANRLLVPMSSAEMLLPAGIGDFTDFVCSTFHAQRVVRKPLDSPLAPALCYMPVAYHGRASSVRMSGEPVRRPHGQFKDEEGVVQFGPSRALDFELELGAFIGAGNSLGSPIPIESASSHIFGYCLLNDWSARDIQFWESMLGPFLSKSLSTTISPWVVTAEALAPFRAPIFTPSQPDFPAPLPYLENKADRAEGGIDIELETLITTRKMRDSGEQPARIVATNFKYAYWSFAQMVAHHASNGCNLQTGDLLGSGTVSGPTDESRACLLEHTEPIHLPNGETRQYLQDEDEVVFTARARRPGYVSLGFGECRARIIAAGG
jgi:fumarylacetoacetase